MATIQELSDLLYRVRLRLNSLTNTVNTLQAGGTSGGTGGGSTSISSTLLASPDGSAWQLSASNSGAVVTTKSTGTGSASLTIKSPDNSSWILTVNNSGIPSTSKI